MPWNFSNVSCIPNDRPEIILPMYRYSGVYIKGMPNIWKLGACPTSKVLCALYQILGCHGV